MPQLLPSITLPTWMLWLYAVVYGLISALANDGEMPRRAEIMSHFALPFVVASWVVADARKRGKRLCYDFDSFVFFVWPVVVPVYLFQTRGVRAFLTLLCFGCICGVGLLTAVVVSRIWEFLW